MLRVLNLTSLHMLNTDECCSQGSFVKENEADHVFGNAQGQSITLTICLLAQAHKYTHALMHMRQTYSAYTHGSLPYWILEGSIITLNVPCKPAAGAWMWSVYAGRVYQTTQSIVF